MKASATANLGATVESSGVTFRVWAPRRRSVAVEFARIGHRALVLERQENGLFVGHSPGAQAGMRYRYRLDDVESHPDPYSRFQPDGPHGPSMVVDPARYAWRDGTWPGLDAARQVIYELHIGTFTPEGTYRAATERLRYLQDLGITCIELMPVNEFQGRFGWGYDGVNWFAPFHHYGEPDDLRAFVDLAHATGLGVIMDVVYNHFGHDGNYLPRFSAEYLTDTVANPWGGAPNYAFAPMRRLAIDNAAYWIREFHLDGLRLDATQSIHDPEHPGLLADLVHEARAAAESRTIIITAEDFTQRTPLLRRRGEGGAGIDQLWNDDFHHACRVALTGNHFGFFRSFRGSAQEIVGCLRQGFLFQGQYDAVHKAPRGFAVDQEPRTAFVAFTQNHDAVANTLYGQRLQTLVSPGNYRALTAALLLGTMTPLIFMGQEFNASAPFSYFADYPDDGGSLWKGTTREAQDFEQYRDPAAVASIWNPCDVGTFQRSVLDFSDRDRNQNTLRLFKDLLALRRTDPVLDQRPTGTVDAAALNDSAFLIRWRGPALDDRLLLVNLGHQIEPRAWAEPLLAPPLGRRWQLRWSSDALQYGGMGTVTPMHDRGWQFASESCCFLVTVADV